MPQLTKSDFSEGPIKAIIRACEIFGIGNDHRLDVSWFSKDVVVLDWVEKCNLNDEPGIIVVSGGWGYAGYDSEYDIHMRYVGNIEDNEHGFRLIKILP